MLHSTELQLVRTKIIQQAAIDENEWNSFVQSLYQKGIPLEPAIKYLYSHKPSEYEFEMWLRANSIPGAYDTNTDNIDDTLTADDLAFWEQNGYIIIKNAISKEDCKHTADTIMHFLHASFDEPSTWYRDHEAKEGLMVLFANDPVLEKNRASLKIRKAFEQLYKTKAIFKSIDKVSFNPPETDGYTFKGSPLHWDTKLEPPIAFELQGLLYLTDVYENSGAFSCVPGFHRIFNEWIKNIPAGENAREYAIKTLQPIPIIADAGDFIIWHQALPHCATANTSSLPRLVQYLTYIPQK
jgi:hypothetical protein